MKKLTLSIACLLGLSAGLMQAQELQSSSSIDVLLNRLNEVGTYSGSVSNFFSKEEQATLHNYFVSHQAVALPAAYYNATSFATGEGTPNTSNFNTNVAVPFTGTYYNDANRIASVIYDNGPYFSVAGSPDISVLEDTSLGMGTFGSGAQLTSSNSISDDFELTDDYDITSIDVFAYQTGSAPPSITGVYMQVWDGDPSATGSTVIWGDLTTNILDNASGTNAFRQLESSPSDTSREIQRVTAATSGLSLTAGTYWIEYTFEGSGPSGPWAPPIVITGASTTGNAIQFTGSTSAWAPIIDVGPQGMPFVISGDLVGGGSPVMAYAIENASAMYGTFDAAAPSTFNRIGASAVGSSDFENAGAMDPSDPNTIYVLDNANNFYSVDATTGVYTTLGSIAAPGTEGWVGLEFDTSDGTLYGLSGTVSASSTLSIIDPVAMTATPIGGAGAIGATGAIALAIDGAGAFYVHDIVDDAIYTVDNTTGVGTLLGATGFNANFGQGMGYDPSSDTVYLTAYNADVGDSELRSLDTATGATTLVGQMEPAASTQYGWSTYAGDDTAGIKDNSLIGFKYYPNPTSGILSLKSVNKIDSVSIYNLLGQQVMNTTVDDTTTNISLSGLSTGAYIMKVSVKGQIGTYKILKN